MGYAQTLWLLRSCLQQARAVKSCTGHLPGVVLVGGGAVTVVVPPPLPGAPGAACPFPFLAAGAAASEAGVAGLAPGALDALRALQAVLVARKGRVCMRRETTFAAGVPTMAELLPLLFHNLHR
jgi:hypothetical protein